MSAGSAPNSRGGLIPPERERDAKGVIPPWDLATIIENEAGGLEVRVGRMVRALPPEGEFLTGGDRPRHPHPEGDVAVSVHLPLDIDDLFAKPFRLVLAEMAIYEPGALDANPDSATTESIKARGYTFHDVRAGVVVKCPAGNLVGGYLSCDLALDDEHQGKGLGRELVIEYFVRNGSLPTWDLDTAAYSHAGLAAHRSAWKAMR